MSVPQLTSIIFALVGLLFVGLGLPLAWRKIGPNWLYGFRTAKTLGDPEIWYAANQAAGVALAIAGVVIAVFSMLLLFIGPMLLPPLGVVIGNLAVMVVCLTATVVYSVLVLRRL